MDGASCLAKYCAQLTNTTFRDAEEKRHLAHTLVPFDPTHNQAGDLPIHPYRYVDNRDGLKRPNTPLESIQ